MDNERIIFETIPGQAYIDAKLVEPQESEKVIDALKYLPDFMQDSEVMKDAAMILNSILKGSDQAKQEFIKAKQEKIAEGWDESEFKEFYWDPINEIHKAYFDTMYKASNYSELSYEAKVEFIKEKGFDYLLNLLFHMYDSNYKNEVDSGRTSLTYEEYVRNKSEESLTKLTMLFNLLYMLKGKTLGLELALSLCGISNFIYMTWDIISHYKGDLFVEKIDNLHYSVEYRTKSDPSDEQYIVEKTEIVEMPTTELNPALLLPVSNVNKGDCWKLIFGNSISGLGTTFYVFNGIAWHETLDEHEFEEPRQPFTATLSLPPADADLQAKVCEFTRNYMLPYIDLKVKLYEEGGTVWAYPTGSSSLKNSLNVWDYYVNSVEYMHGLEHYVSEECWRYSIKKLGSNLQIGAPALNEQGFQGKVDLAKSYVEDPNGVKHYLYGTRQTIPDIVTGTARDRYTAWDTIDSFDGTYIAGPLIKGAVNVDIVTGNQVNPEYHIENDTIVYDDGDVIASILSGNGFVYGHKVTTSNKYAYGLPWEQPTLTENGVMGGDSFAVTSHTIRDESDTGIDISIIPSDARYFDGSYYKVYTKTITWQNAKLECEGRGGHLATITSQAQQNFIDSITGRTSGYWLGGFEENVEGSWRWITDEPWDYTYWDEGEPNDSHETGEDYLITWTNGRWNDLDTNNTGESCGYICEWDNIDSSEWGTTSTWQAFDGSNDYGSNCFHTKFNALEGYIDIYNPNPLNVTNIQIQNQNDAEVNGRASRSGTIYGSNDGENWATITTYTNNHGDRAESWNIDLSSNHGYYNYYRIYSDGIIGNVSTDTSSTFIIDTSDNTQFIVKGNTALSQHQLVCNGDGASFCTKNKINLGSYNTWEIGTSFVYNDRSNDDRGAIFGFWSDTDYKSVSLCYDFNTRHASVLRPYISTTGESFNVVPLDWTTNYTPSVSLPVSGRTYNVAMGYDGTKFYIKYSEGNNELQTVWELESQSNIFANDLANIVIGNSFSGGNIAAQGVRDHSMYAIWNLDNTYIKANNEIIWKPTINDSGDNYYIQDDKIIITDSEPHYWTIGEIKLTATQANIAAEDTETVVYGVEWHQPIPIDAGVMGGSTFAVRSNVPQWRSPETEAWKAFDLSNTVGNDYNKTCATFHSAHGYTSGWIDFYNPNPLNVTKLIITNQLDGSAGRASASGTIYGSDDGENWVPLVAYTNNNGSVGGVWTIDLTHNENYFKYHRWESNGIIGGGSELWTCKSIEVVATQCIVLTTNVEYQYDQDWTQPKLTSNGVLGGNNFAVYTNVDTETGFDLYNAFDGKTETWNGKSFLSKYGTTKGYIDIYNPNPLKVTNIHIVNQQGYDGNGSTGISIDNEAELIRQAFAYDCIDTSDSRLRQQLAHVLEVPVYEQFGIPSTGEEDSTFTGTGTYLSGRVDSYIGVYDWRGDLLSLEVHNSNYGSATHYYYFVKEEDEQGEIQTYLRNVKEVYDTGITIVTTYNNDKTLRSHYEYWTEEDYQSSNTCWSREYTYSVNSSGYPIQQYNEFYNVTGTPTNRTITVVKSNVYTNYVDDEYQSEYTDIVGATYYRASTSGIIYGSNDGIIWKLITTYNNDIVGVGYSWDIDLSLNTAYYKYYRIESTQNSYENNYLPYSKHWAINELTLTAKQATIVAKTTETHTEYDIDSAPVLGDLNVYGGRVSTVKCSNTAGNITFTTDTPYVRTYTGTEIHNLTFGDVYVNPDKYTGINDLGVLGSNTYFIYNGMLFRNVGNDYIQLGTSDNWTDVGASHAISNIYYTPAICDNNLYGLKDTEIKYFYPAPNQSYQTGQWTCITGYINDEFTAYGINNGRLFSLYLDGSTLRYKLLDTTRNWTYVTGVSYSDTYAAYGIADTKLYKISDIIEEVKLTETLLIDDATKARINNGTITFTTAVGTDNISDIVYYSGNAEERKLSSFKFNGNLIIFNYNSADVEIKTVRGITTYTTNNISLSYRNDILQNITVITSAYTAKIAFRNNAVSKYTLDESETVSGWTNQISRYHHNNDDYYSYGICNGVLYYINNDKAGRVHCDIPLGWTDVCGYYNDVSPRTWGYALNNNVLYSLQKDQAIVRNNTQSWKKITGSAFNTVTYILGLTNDGYIYKINSSKLQKLDERQGWTDIFGRYSTMAESINDCFGYGIITDRNGSKLISFGKNEIHTIAGFWRENGVGRKVQLTDYNITDMDLRLGVNNHVIGEDAIRYGYPHTPTDKLSNYDIKVVYTTVGFDNYTRYNIKTELQDFEYRYIYPDYKPCLDLSHTNGFNPKKGAFEEYTHLYATKIGNQNINGNGEAYEFKQNKSCLQLPIKTETHTEEDNSGYYSVTNDITPEEVFISYGCMYEPGDTSLNPIVVDKNGATGLFYGLYNGVYGTYLKTNTGYILVEQIEEDHHIQRTIKFVKNGNHYNVVCSRETSTYNFNSGDVYINYPYFIGGYPGNYGNSIVFLSDSYIKYDQKQYLFTNGEYIGFTTNFNNIDIRVETDTNQENRKVLDVKSGNDYLFELYQNKIYSHLDTEVVSGNLTASTNYNVNRIRTARQEGETYTTLKYSGAYTLDPNKAYSNGNMLARSRYSVDAIAKYFNDYDNLSININQLSDTPLDLHLSYAGYTNSEYVYRYNTYEVPNRRGIVASQVIYDIITLNGNDIAIFQVPYTSSTDNDLIRLLSSEDYIYVKGYNIDWVDNALKFTLLSDTVTEQLKTYMQSYNIVSKSYLKSYTATIYEPQKLLSSELEDVYINKPILKSTINVNYIGGIDYEVVSSGDIYELCTDKAQTITRELEYNSEGFDIDPNKLIVNSYDGFDRYTAILSPIAGGTELILDTSNIVTTQSQSIAEGDTEPTLVINCTPPSNNPQEFVKIDDEIAYVSGTGKKYVKFHIKKIANGLDTSKLTLSANSSTIEKDKLQIRDGVSYRYNKFNYLTTKNINSWYGLSLALINSDDVYIDQGIVECGNKSIFIKDGALTYKNGNTYTRIMSLNTSSNLYIGLFNFSEESITESEHGNEQDLELYYNQLNVAKFYYSENGKDWIQLSDEFTPTNLTIGYAQTDTDKLGFNGFIDLTKSYYHGADYTKSPLYSFSQITTLRQSDNNITWTNSTTITTPIIVNTVRFTGEFMGSLDCYASKLLTSYDLYWTEDRTNIETVIKNELLEKDSTYNPDNHDMEYNIEAYGIQLFQTPNRWDRITITYSTEDKAVYELNGDYKLKVDVINDENVGKISANAIGEPQLSNSIASGFTENDAFSYDLNNKDYVVVCITPYDTNTTQGVIGYEGNYTQSILIDNNSWKYFDGYNTYNLNIPVELGQEIYLKLYTYNNNIEYSYDNVNWTQTEVQCAFSAYDYLILGNGQTSNSRSSLIGEIDLSKTYGVKNGDIEYLYQSYKKLMPYISSNGTTWKALTISPILTTDDFITFGKLFNGTVNLYKSDLLIPDCTYWTANKINIYSKIDYEEDNTQSGEFVYSVIRDEMPILSQVGASGSTEPTYSDYMIDGNLAWTKLTKGSDVTLTDEQMNFVISNFVDISAFTQIKRLTTLKGQYIVVLVKLNDRAKTPQAKLFDFNTQTVIPVKNWKANTLFDMYDIITDNDNYYQVSHVEDSQYYQVNEKVKVNPTDLEVNIVGFPNVGNTVKLTYNDWYLFSNVKSQYDFRVEYEGSKCYISCQKYNPEYDPDDEFCLVEPYYKHVLYITDRKNITVNVGYEFDGAVIVKDSYYGDLVLCDYEEWLYYAVLYKKHNESEWNLWREFAVNRDWDIRMAAGFDLLGKMYLLSSYIQTDVYTTAFVVYYDGEYIEPIGNVLFDSNGNAYNFTNDWYLRLRNKSIAVGNKIYLYLTTSDDVSDQGIATGVSIQSKNMVETAFPTNILHRAVPNRTVCLVYEFNPDYTVSFKMIGYYFAYCARTKEPNHTLTIIPVKVIHTGQYIETMGHRQEVLEYEYLTDDEIGRKLTIQYRIMKSNQEYDYFTEIATNDLQWYNMSIKKGNLEYYKEDIENIYYGHVTTGYYYDYRGNTINVDPNGIEYYRGDKIEYRVIIGNINEPEDIRVNNIILYEDKKIKQGIQF